MLCRKEANHKSDEFPYRSHDYNNTETRATSNSLHGMYNASQQVEDSEDEGCNKGRVVGPRLKIGHDLVVIFDDGS